MKKEGNKDRFISFSLLAIFVSAFLLLFFFIEFPTTGNFAKYGTGPYTYNCSNCSDCNAAIIDASPGDTILLNQSISASEPSGCINITNKSNLVLDCANNVISGSSGLGLFLNYSNDSQIKNCTFTGFNSGVSLVYSNNNTFVDIRANNNVVGIIYLESHNNTLHRSFLDHNSGYGVYIYNSYTNFIYNNIFNNTNNVDIYPPDGSIPTFFNSTLISAANIIEGGYNGGNFWATPAGIGFSQNCTSDVDNNYICDHAYNLNGSYDYLPLIFNTVNITSVTCTESWTCANWSICINRNQTRTCTDSNSCRTNTTRPALLQSCSVVTNTTSNVTANTTIPTPPPVSVAVNSTGASGTQDRTAIILPWGLISFYAIIGVVSIVIIIVFSHLIKKVKKNDNSAMPPYKKW